MVLTLLPSSLIKNLARERGVAEIRTPFGKSRLGFSNATFRLPVLAVHPKLLGKFFFSKVIFTGWCGVKLCKVSYFPWPFGPFSKPKCIVRTYD